MEAHKRGRHPDGKSSEASWGGDGDVSCRAEGSQALASTTEELRQSGSHHTVTLKRGQDSDKVTWGFSSLHSTAALPQS